MNFVCPLSQRLRVQQNRAEDCLRSCAEWSSQDSQMWSPRPSYNSQSFEYRESSGNLGKHASNVFITWAEFFSLFICMLLSAIRLQTLTQTLWPLHCCARTGPVTAGIWARLSWIFSWKHCYKCVFSPQFSTLVTADSYGDVKEVCSPLLHEAAMAFFRPVCFPGDVEYNGWWLGSHPGEQSGTTPALGLVNNNKIRGARHIVHRVTMPVIPELLVLAERKFLFIFRVLWNMQASLILVITIINEQLIMSDFFWVNNSLSLDR